MDKKSRTVNIIKEYNLFNNNEIGLPDFITSVCNFYDSMKNEELSESDKKLLKILAVDCGIPHYFDMMRNFDERFELDNIDVGSFSKIYKECGFFLNEEVMLHKSQMEVLTQMLENKKERFLLTAPTSFGKTFIVNEYIKKKQFKMVCLIFPTIALLSENLERFHTDSFYSDSYSIHTLSNVEVEVNQNLFIYTPERFLSFLDVNPNFKFDFIFIDEMYKIDSSLDNTDNDKSVDRDLTYRITVEESTQRSSNILLAGPYIKLSEDNGNSFGKFLSDNGFTILNKNQVEIVNKESVNTNDATKREFIVDNFKVDFGRKTMRRRRLQVLIEKLIEINNENNKTVENAIIFCDTKRNCELMARVISSFENLRFIDDSDFLDFISHIESRYHEDLLLCKSLRKGVAIHNSSIPKYIQKEIIYWFNKGVISFLIATTTITEGVNTSTKNIIVYSHKKGTKLLRTFDAKNIVGRAGRFMEHYVGRIFYFDEDDKFRNILLSDPKDLEHVNYDIEIDKSDVDLDITKEKYLSKNDKTRKGEIDEVVSESNITEEVLEGFKVFSRLDKAHLYNVLESDFSNLKRDIRLIRRSMFYNSKLNFDAKMALQNILKYTIPFIDEGKDENFLRLLEVPSGKVQMIIVSILDTYLNLGVVGIYRYNLNYFQRQQNSNAINRAFSETSKTIYSILRYQMAKYISLVDRIYKSLLVEIDDVDPEVAQEMGLFGLLELLEYGARTEDGKLCSDFGVPYTVLKLVEENQGVWNTNEVDIEKYELDTFEKSKFQSFKDYIDNIKN